MLGLYQTSPKCRCHIASTIIPSRYQYKRRKRRQACVEVALHIPTPTTPGPQSLQPILIPVQPVPLPPLPAPSTPRRGKLRTPAKTTSTWLTNVYKRILSIVDCSWSEWTNYGDCSASCGIGTQMKVRVKIPESDGGECGEDVDDVMNQICNPDPCPGMIIDSTVKHTHMLVDGL